MDLAEFLEKDGHGPFLSQMLTSLAGADTDLPSISRVSIRGEESDIGAVHQTLLRAGRAAEAAATELVQAQSQKNDMASALSETLQRFEARRTADAATIQITQQRVDGLTSEVDGLKSEVDGLKSEVDRLSGRCLRSEQVSDDDLEALALKLNDSHKAVMAEQVRRSELRASEATDSKLCCVCLDSPKTILLLPCAHLCVCVSCSQEIQAKPQPTCPMWCVGERLCA
jgi:hypothetical protein